MSFAISNLVGDPFYVITLLMGISGWIIALAGSILNNSSSSRFPIFSWWGLAFQFLVYALATYAILINRISMYRHTLLALLAVATVYSTNSTNNFVWQDSSDAAATAAGQILLSVVNIIWILFFGTSADEPVHAFAASFASAKRPADPGIRHRTRAPTTATSQRTGDDPFAGRNYHPPMQNQQSFPQLYTSDQLRGFEEIDSQAHSHREQDHDPYGLEMATKATMPEGVRNSTDAASPAAPSRDPMLVTSSAGPSGQLADQSQHQRNTSAYTGYTDQDSLSQPTNYIYKARALFDYRANAMDVNELSFDQNEVLEISDITGRWWQARRANGEVGICPSNYVVLLNP